MSRFEGIDDTQDRGGEREGRMQSNQFIGLSLDLSRDPAKTTKEWFPTRNRFVLLMLLLTFMDLSNIHKLLRLGLAQNLKQLKNLT